MSARKLIVLFFQLTRMELLGNHLSGNVLSTWVSLTEVSQAVEPQVPYHYEHVMQLVSAFELRFCCR